MGDAILSSPLPPRLKAAYPGSRLDVLASPSNRAIFEADPDVDRVIVADRNWFNRGQRRSAIAPAVWRLGRSLRPEDYDLGIDVRGDVLTVLVLALAGIPRRVGWAMGGGGFLLTDVARWVPGRHEVRSRLALLEALGIPDEGPARLVAHARDRDRARVAACLRAAWPARARGARTRGIKVAAAAGMSEGVARDRARLEPPDPERLHAGRFGSEAPLLVVHLGAGTGAKRWPPGHWRALVSRFLADGWRVIVIGGAEEVGASAALGTHRNLRDWTGKLALPETASLLERADLFVGSDSGPAHLAACAGVTSVILFSGTNRVRQWRPWSRRALVLRHKVPCRPCHQKSCPLADHPCMTGLTPDRVYRAARRWWARLHREESPHAPL